MQPELTEESARKLLRKGVIASACVAVQGAFKHPDSSDEERSMLIETVRSIACLAPNCGALLGKCEHGSNRVN